MASVGKRARFRWRVPQHYANETRVAGNSQAPHGSTEAAPPLDRVASAAC